MIDNDVYFNQSDNLMRQLYSIHVFAMHTINCFRYSLLHRWIRTEYSFLGKINHFNLSISMLSFLKYRNRNSELAKNQNNDYCWNVAKIFQHSNVLRTDMHTIKVYFAEN